ncbi:hypothetical protein KR222_006561, partial [Zaprionus bogoriensis]
YPSEMQPTLRFQLLLMPLITAIAKIAIEPRVYGGQQTSMATQGGFALQIHYKTHFVCTGSLLSFRHALSSAHCFEGVPYDQLHVISGKPELQFLMYYHEKNKILKLRKHPDFKKTKFIADIAVFSVSFPIRTGDIGYAKLCSQPPAPGDIVTISGYGHSKKDDQSLHSADMPIISIDECIKLFERKLPPNVLCTAGYKKGKTLCTGDSGGALVNRGELCGVNTWTYKCGNNVLPDIFMSVFYYREFIEQTMKDFG